MQPLIFMAVGYITGIIWGLYLKINIVPIIFIAFGGVFLLKHKFIDKYKINLVLLIIFILVSNIQIKILENKFDNLYKGIDEVEIIRSYHK